MDAANASEHQKWHDTELHIKQVSGTWEELSQVEIGANQTRSGWFKLNVWWAELIGSVLT